MSFYVYIIESTIDNSYYKGFTEEPMIRLQRHNNGESKYTRTKLPWKYVYIEQVASKGEGLIREKVLKKYSHDQIKQLINSGKNNLKDIMDSSVV